MTTDGALYNIDADLEYYTNKTNNSRETQAIAYNVMGDLMENTHYYRDNETYYHGLSIIGYDQYPDNDAKIIISINLKTHNLT